MKNRVMMIAVTAASLAANLLRPEITACQVVAKPWSGGIRLIPPAMPALPIATIGGGPTAAVRPVNSALTQPAAMAGPNDPRKVGSTLSSLSKKLAEAARPVGEISQADAETARDLGRRMDAIVTGADEVPGDAEGPHDFKAPPLEGLTPSPVKFSRFGESQANTTVIAGVRVRLDAEESPEFSVEDLCRSSDPDIRALAKLDKNEDQWVSRAEISEATDLYASTHFKYAAMVREAQRAIFGEKSIKTLRAQNAGGKNTVRDAGPAPVNPGAHDYKAMRRSSYIPLAEFLARRYAEADSYEALYGDPGDRIFHFDGDDIVARYSLHEIKAALAILTARESSEFGISRDGNGRHHFVEGKPDKVEFDRDITGFDQVFHTHPTVYSNNYQRGPSAGDWDAARQLDPDHRGCVVTQDGWSVNYHALDHENKSSDPEPLWSHAP